MSSFIAFVACFVAMLYFLASGNLFCAIPEIVLMVLNFQPAIEWLRWLYER